MIVLLNLLIQPKQLINQLHKGECSTYNQKDVRGSVTVQRYDKRIYVCCWIRIPLSQSSDCFTSDCKSCLLLLKGCPLVQNLLLINGKHGQPLSAAPGTDLISTSPLSLLDYIKLEPPCIVNVSRPGQGI